MEQPVRPAPAARQVDILFDPACYTAFPHIARLEGAELLLAFRQAPREDRVFHHHPRSIITVVRSPDLGASWKLGEASQLAAGGGQELGLLYLGHGLVVGALAQHQVAANYEAPRTRMEPDKYPKFGLRNGGVYWTWSDDYGLTWPLCHNVWVARDDQPCAPPIRLQDGTLLIPAYLRAERLDADSSILYRSTDGGKTWAYGGAMALGNAATRTYAEPAIVELEPGHLRAMHRIEDVKVGTPRCLWTNESLDGGLTWSEPVDTGIVAGPCPRLLKLADGRLLLTYGRRVASFGIRAQLSADGGRSWGAPWLLREAPNSNQGYTSSIELGDGRVLTVTYCENAAGVTGIVGTFWQLP
jgi:hypothetical protein